MPPAVAWERAMKNRLPPEKISEEYLDILCRGVTEACTSSADWSVARDRPWHRPNETWFCLFQRTWRQRRRHLHGINQLVQFHSISDVRVVRLPL